MATDGESRNRNESAVERDISKDEMFCPECGKTVLRKAATCPNCGVALGGEDSSSGEKRLLGATGHATIGGLSGFLAFIFLPIIFGPLSMFCGIQLYRKHDELAGVGIFLLGGAGMVVGMLLGLMAWGGS